MLLAALIVFSLLIGIVIGSMEKARQDEALRKQPEPDSELPERIGTLRDSLAVLEDDLRRNNRSN